MFDLTRHKRTRLVLLVAFAIGLVGSGLVLAGKPGSGGGTVPPGTIYFIDFSSTYLSWSMKGDGSGKLQSIGGQPSQQRHGNLRWFLQSQNDISTGKGQWFAVDENNATIQLTSESNRGWNGVPPSWAKDDSFFSYSSVYETETEWIGCLFVVDIDWIGDIPVSSTPTMVFEIRRSVFDEFGEWSSDGYEEVDLGRHDWSPSANEVALSRWEWGTGGVLDIASFTVAGVETRRLFSGAENPQWSPDGNLIAFNRINYSGWQEIRDVWTTKPDGTSAIQLTKYIAGKQGSSSTYGTSQRHPVWSPDGKYLAYTERVISGQTTDNVCRIPAAGGSKTSLTSNGQSSSPFWRP